MVLSHAVSEMKGHGRETIPPCSKRLAVIWIANCELAWPILAGSLLGGMLRHVAGSVLRITPRNNHITVVFP